MPVFNRGVQMGEGDLATICLSLMIPRPSVSRGYSFRIYAIVTSEDCVATAPERLRERNGGRNTVTLRPPYFS
jgi:hypothetical protein